jgi:hypothetical protein
MIVRDLDVLVIGGGQYPANYLSLGREGDAPCPW